MGNLLSNGSITTFVCVCPYMCIYIETQVHILHREREKREEGRRGRERQRERE